MFSSGFCLVYYAPKVTELIALQKPARVRVSPTYSCIARITTHFFVVTSSALVTLVRLPARRPAHAFPDVEVQSRPVTMKGKVM